MCNDPYAPIRAALHTLRLHGFTGVLVVAWVAGHPVVTSEGTLGFGPDAARLWTTAHQAALQAVRGWTGQRVVMAWREGVPTATHCEQTLDSVKTPAL